MLSKRLTIQWPPEEPGENTSTMVVYSKDGHFVDIRIFKDHYPIINENPTSLEDFTKVFEWTMTGDEIEQVPDFPDSYKLQFTHEIDSMAITRSITEGKPLEQCANDPDIGTFWKIPGSEDRKETGHMVNPDTGKDQEYIEIWRTVSSLQHKPTEDVREVEGEQDGHLYVLRIESIQFHGQFIRTGNWCQGLLHDKLNKTVPLNVVRAYYNGEKWEYLIKYGSFNFPIDFDGAQGDTVESDGLLWTCFEK